MRTNKFQLLFITSPITNINFHHHYHLYTAMIINSDKVSSNGTFRLATDGFSSQFKNFGSRDNNVRDAAPYMCEELCAPATLWTVAVRVIWFTRWRHWPFSCTSTECFFSELRFYSFHCSDPRQIDHFTTRAVEFLSNDVPRVETRWFRPWLIYNQRRCFFLLRTLT